MMRKLEAIVQRTPKRKNLSEIQIILLAKKEMPPIYINDHNPNCIGIIMVQALNY